MSGGQRSRRGRGTVYWLSLLIGCVLAVVVVGLIYFHFAPEQLPHVIPTPTYSKGPGGLYDPGVTLEPNPPVTQVP